MTEYFIQAFIYLASAVILVPLAKKLGMGSVLGYLIAGVIIGPLAGLVGQETNTIQHFAEFGVVMMLFLVGLELAPQALWRMRKRLFGLGGLQVTLTTGLFAAIGMQFGLHWSTALAVASLLALSSTAIVLQTMNEKGLNKTDGANASLSVLLFQDIAVIPILALMPLLALPELVQEASKAAAEADAHGGELSLVAQLPAWGRVIVVAAAIGGLGLIGHFLTRPLFRFVADAKLHEVFTAAALMLVIGISALMALIGLSPALGAFLAGVILANSEFRHELEASIDPFKGLLLGLFFITVGAGIDFDVFMESWRIILLLTLALMVSKAGILLTLAFIFKVRAKNRWLFALSLAQAGEFGFVLLNYGVGQSVIPQELAQMLSMVVALSMFLTPALFILFDKVVTPRYSKLDNLPFIDEIDQQGPVIIAGIGRFGQIVNRMLTANGIETVVLDDKHSQISLMHQIGVKSFYGDATKPDLLRMAGVDDALLVVVAIGDKDKSVRLVEHLKHAHPHVQILARALDRIHSYELRAAKADYVITETYNSAVELGRDALFRLGLPYLKAERIRKNFIRMDREHDDILYANWRETGGGAADTSFHTLFIKLEKLLRDAIKADMEAAEEEEKQKEQETTGQ
ncbi:MAG: monovalent cation:proton antiporter-2 (CPA2) family protein [Alphaproteobacteria bacterium]